MHYTHWRLYGDPHRTKNNVSIDWARVRAMYVEQGMNTTEIAAELGVNKRTLCGGVARLGIVRPRSVRSRGHGKPLGRGPFYIHGYPAHWVGGRIVYLHREAMERKLGRALRRDEIVHHINGVRTDYREENLELMALGRHNTLHNVERMPRAIRDKRGRFKHFEPAPA